MKEIFFGFFWNGGIYFRIKKYSWNFWNVKFASRIFWLKKFISGIFKFLPGIIAIKPGILRKKVDSDNNDNNFLRFKTAFLV